MHQRAIQVALKNDGNRRVLRLQLPKSAGTSAIERVHMQLDVLKIVVIEDDFSMSQAIERILRAAGYKPMMFGSAEAAIESGIASHSDCLVIDINLPGMSGFELYERLVPHGALLPAIFITAHDDPSFRARAAALGASSYHPKPFFGRTLLTAVHQALQSH